MFTSAAVPTCVATPSRALAEALHDELARGRTTFPARACVTCQGTAGAYSEQAARRLFAEPDIRFVPSFDDVFRAVECSETPYGVLPVENSTAGSVAAVYDLMRLHRFRIVRAVRLRIDHALLGVPGAREEDVREVVSHPQALAQCSRYFARHPGVRATPVSNTAVAARRVAEEGRRDLAALASPTCATLYGLAPLCESVADVANNSTRFLCIARDLELYPDACKTTLVFTVPHRPGTLYRVMGRFAEQGLNLTKIESRAIPGSDFEYRFIVDLEASPFDARVAGLLADLASSPDLDSFEYLGSYAEA